ncbi:MAG: GGDEF domain-containing protein [Sulfobacillus sp.]
MRTGQTVTLPLGALPIWAVALLCLLSVPFFGSLPRMGGEALAGPFARLSLAVGLALADEALWLGASSASAALPWARLAIPLALFAGVSAVDGVSAIIRSPRPLWLRGAWAVAGLVLIGSWFQPSWVMAAVAPSAGGGWLTAVGTGPLAVFGILVTIFCLGTALLLFARQALRPGSALKWRLYALLTVVMAPVFLFTFVLGVSDGLTTSWVAALGGWSVLWVEMRGQAGVQQTYLRQDQTTQSYNRRWGEEYLAACLKRGPAAVLYADLDDFKAINDRYGHGVGDSVLEMVSRRLIGVLRSEDIVARLGGDEFMVVLPGVHAAQIPGILHRVEAALSSPALKVPASDQSVGISLGAAHAEKGGSWRDLVQRADRRMYLAKAGHQGSEESLAESSRSAVDTSPAAP